MNQQALTDIMKPELADLAAAYTKAWGEIDNVVKNANNPHFRSSYADLGAVLDTVRPVFAANGLAILTAPGEMTGEQMTLAWMLIHSSGQYVNGRMSLPVGAKATAQAGGSALTYMRRYLTAAIGGIAQVDDDGNAASEPPRQSKSKSKSKVDGDYAKQAEAYIAAIEATDSIEALDAMKPELAEFGDQKVADAFAARKRELRGRK